MSRWINRIFFSFCFLVVTTLGAQPRSGYALGDAVDDFTVKSTDNRAVTLRDYQAQKGLIVVFSSNHCPFSRIYEERIQAIDRQFAPQGYPVLAIMPNDPTVYPEDSFANMQRRADEQHYPYTYAIDESQQATRRFGASRTPQVFVLKQTNGQFIVEYTGAIDDNPQDRAGVKRNYVDEAVSSLLAGRPVSTPITKAVGCAVKLRP
ncbi:thioredoxin family protein [uncultured Spirosoma sp.]|uniref:thioredoxin family protein n=1 Tax=uncultured Spirosoma sp. TaxID=278208 RepID=UPI00258610BC|nr:thioredoxin family protein [uncultured Spirosoma sp.]